MRPEDRDRIVREVTKRVVGRHGSRAASAPEGYLETVVNDTLYHERQRLKNEDSSSKKARAERSYYRKVQKRLGRAADPECRELLDDCAGRFAAEVVGSFNQRIYELSTSAIPVGLAFLLDASSPRRLLSMSSLRRGLGDHVELRGEIEHVKKLRDHGTLLILPTHSSHLDSIMLGYAVFLMGVPPLLYGAGLNLFTNPMTSFFMNNLGAYRVDRKKSAPLYKEVLKEYAACSLEMGYDNLFFPGGTRSRSGAVESKLKKGLLGTGVSAYVNNLRNGKDKAKIFAVPCTISYELVLEAETLIGDHLQEVGKSRYIIEDDEFSKPRKVLNFLSELASLDAKIVVTFSKPLDVVGNEVDEEGRSLDPRGRVVDTARYVMQDGEPVHDTQRDMQYTHELSDAVARAFLTDNVVMATHVVARALFDSLTAKNPGLDLYRFLHTGGEVASIPRAALALEVERLTKELGELRGGPRLGSELERLDALGIVDAALRYFGTYHTRPAACRRGDDIFHEDRNLLLYYSNRLRGYDLGRRLGKGDADVGPQSIGVLP